MQLTPLSERTQVVQDTNTLQNQITQLQGEEASGLTYTAPDQAPSTIVASMTLSQDVTTSGWNASNLTTAKQVLSTTSGALENMVQVVNQASSLAVQASNSSNTVPGGLEALAATAEGYVQQFANLLNTQANGVSVFAGAHPYAPVTTGTSITNAPALGSTAWSWQLPVQAQSSMTITANGYEAGIAPGSTSVFQNTMGALKGLVSAIHSQHPSTAEAALTSVATQLNTLTTYVGAQAANVDTYIQQSHTAATALKENLATTTQVNLPNVLSQIAADTTAYQAALQSTGALLQLSLWQNLTFP